MDLTVLWADSRFLPPFESFTFTTFVLPAAMEKLALPSVTTFFFPLEVVTALAVFRTSLPTQLVFALAGQDTETGTLPFFTVTVCLGIFTPGNWAALAQMVGLVPETFDLLRKAGVALCLHDARAQPVTAPVTAGFVYVRRHGTSGRYHGSYSEAMLRADAHRVRGWLAQGLDVYVYFNNDGGGAAVKNARRLGELLEGGGV